MVLSIFSNLEIEQAISKHTTTVCTTFFPLLINIWPNLCYILFVWYHLQFFQQRNNPDLTGVKENIFEGKQVHMSAMMGSTEQSLRDLCFSQRPMFQLLLVQFSEIILNSQYSCMLKITLCSEHEFLEFLCIYGLGTTSQILFIIFGVEHVLTHEFRYEISTENRQMCNTAIQIT